MLLAELTALTMLLSATALCSLDTAPGRAALYVVARYRRHRRVQSRHV